MVFILSGTTIVVVKCGNQWWGKVGKYVSRGLSPISSSPDILTNPNISKQSYPHCHIVRGVFIHICIIFYMFQTCGKLYLSPRLHDKMTPMREWRYGMRRKRWGHYTTRDQKWGGQKNPSQRMSGSAWMHI